MKAAEKLVAVYVDCEWGKSYGGLASKYGVRGYPTIVFATPEGEEVARVKDRSAAAIQSQIADVAEKHKTVILLHPSWEKALSVAKKEKKPILYLFSTEDKFGKFVEACLLDSSNKKTRERFVLAKGKLTTDSADAQKFKVANSKESVVLILDPREDKPEEKQYRLPSDIESLKDLLSWLHAVADKLAE